MRVLTLDLEAIQNNVDMNSYVLVPYQDIIKHSAREFLRRTQEDSRGNFNFYFNRRGEPFHANAQINCGSKYTCNCFPTTCFFAYKKLCRLMMHYMEEKCTRSFADKKYTYVIFASGLNDKTNPLTYALKHLSYPDVLIEEWLRNVSFCVVISCMFNVTFII